MAIMLFEEWSILTQNLFPTGNVKGDQGNLDDFRSPCSFLWILGKLPTFLNLSVFICNMGVTVPIS